jgi:N-acetylglucosamine malate deacetylase 1
VLARKRSLLAKHRSQKEWLDVSQGMDSYLADMEEAARIVGQRSKHFEFAEGWRRHLHLGFAASDTDPLRTIVGDRCWLDPEAIAEG